MTTTTMKMHFTIHGEWLTDFCRARWADEGEPAHAVKILEDGFPMFGMRTIMAILTGSKKLVGSSDDPGMSLEDDNATKTEHGNELAFAVVLNKTLHAALMKIADEKLNPIIKRFLDSFDEDRRPSRTLSPRTVDRANQLLIGEALETFSEMRPHLPRAFIGNKNAQLLVDFMAAQEGTIEAKVGPVKGNWCGWIKPSGDFYPCKYYQHDALADALGFKNGDEMLNLRWVKVQERNQGVIEKPADIYWNRLPTKKQIDTIWDWCQQNNRTFPKDELDRESERS